MKRSIDSHLSVSSGHTHHPVRLAPAAVLVLAACGGGSEPASHSSASAALATVATPATMIAQSLPRGGSTTVSVHTLPRATCSLRAATDGPGASGRLTFFSDDDGTARVYLHHADPTVQSAALALDCVDDGGRGLTHAIQLTVDDAAVTEAPPRSRRWANSRCLRSRRPDVAQRRRVIRRGYPPRPDPIAYPDQYALWRNVVASTPTVIKPHYAADPAGVHGPAPVTNGRTTATLGVDTSSRRRLARQNTARSSVSCQYRE